ncbi:MAG: ATP-dependent zinc metalloprotease FtsH [Ktedonobacteraceae bacterium]|nr:ATP-dependent zinc metalloprotease FtsH [Ktedonobacteraceae bacterium]
MFWKFLTTQRGVLFTGVLLLLLVVLLFGIASQLRPPAVSSAPSGMTAIDYSTLVRQVRDGNVVAVILQHDEIDGLLRTPLTQSSDTPSTNGKAANNGVDYASWMAQVRANSPTWTKLSAVSVIDPARAVFTRLPRGGDTQLLALLLSKGVTVTALSPTTNPLWADVLVACVSVLFALLLLLGLLMSRHNTHPIRSVGDRATQMGRSRARRFVRAKKAPLTKLAAPGMGQMAKPASSRVSLEPPVTFADVAGIDEVRVELEEIVQFLRDAERFTRMGARIPRGVLLVGPPGTGKTLLAKAVAGEADVPFFSMSGSEFVEMFVGVGASRVRDLFKQARHSAPCVVFIDEIDAVGRKRSAQATRNDEWEQTLNQLLVELDGFDTRHAVVVLAATNRVDMLDKALLRPGRFDRRITVSLPDRAGREAILRVHTRRSPLHEGVSLERLARLSTGMSGADLANLVNEAALCAARQNLQHISHECFEDALVRVQLGALRPLVLSERERRIIAHHEAGHALVAHYLPEADTVHRVTILPRGQSLGVTQLSAEEDRYNYSRQTLMARIAVGLGGRVAEELTFGLDQITTGAENDLQVVTDLARRMVTRWGMSERLGLVFADGPDAGNFSLNMRRIDPTTLPAQSHSLAMDADGRFFYADSLSTHQQLFSATAAPRGEQSPALQATVDAEVQRILAEGREMARTLLSEHAAQLTLLADSLMEHEQLNRAQFEALLATSE